MCRVKLKPKKPSHVSCLQSPSRSHKQGETVNFGQRSDHHAIDGGLLKWGYPKMDGLQFTMDIPTKLDDLRGPIFQKTTRSTKSSLIPSLRVRNKIHYHLGRPAASRARVSLTRFLGDGTKNPYENGLMTILHG